jgi:hypothetical protein
VTCRAYFRYNLVEFYSLVLVFYFWQYWGLNSGLHACWTGALPLEPLHQPEFHSLELVTRSHIAYEAADRHHEINLLR